MFFFANLLKTSQLENHKIAFLGFDIHVCSSVSQIFHKFYFMFLLQPAILLYLNSNNDLQKSAFKKNFEKYVII